MYMHKNKYLNLNVVQKAGLSVKSNLLQANDYDTRKYLEKK